jgi:hypothetical protein
MAVMKKIATAFVLTAAVFGAEPALAVLPLCAASDLSSTASPTNTPFAGTTCQGFFDDNLLSGSPADVTAQVSALNTLLGSSVYSTATFDFDSLTKLTGLSGLKTIDFPGVLNGQTLIGVHYGNGQGSPGDVDGGDSTAFYLFDAGASLDKFYLTYNASSNVVLYSTGGTTAVPEPATWLLTILGFGLIGGAMRRRAVIARTRMSYV